MQINVTFDPSVNQAPAGFIPAVDYVVNYFHSLFTNNVTLNIDVLYQNLSSGNLAENQASQFVSTTYSSVRSALQAEGAPGASALPPSSPLPGSSLSMTQAEAQALGLYPNDGSLDGHVWLSSTAPFSYSPTATPASNQFYFVGIVEHEISELMGRVSFLSYSPIDLYRYSSPGVHDLTTGGKGSTAYFSIDNGTTNLGTWNNQSSNGDLADWYPQGPATGGNDAFNDYINPGVLSVLSSSDITLMEALGWTTTQSSQVPTVTSAMIQAANLGILRIADTAVDASAVAASINSGQLTFSNYVDQLIGQAHSTTIPAVAVEASMYGVTGTSAEITNLTNNFLPAQVANAISHGLNPQVYACEVVGLAFAFGNETGSTAFTNNFGPSNSGMPNTTAGDAAFATAACNTIFGAASTANLVNVLKTFVSNWEGFYTSAGIPGNASPTANQIDLAARGAAWGDMVGVALANNLGPLYGQVVNFLDDAAQGTAVYGTSLVGQPVHQPFA